jgi:hypothetical protein
MDFLRYVDVLIGLAIVMVLLSPLVTAWTQFWMWVSRARPAFLRMAIARLILHIDGAAIQAPDADAIARAVVMNPMVRSGNSPATVIQREELTAILLQLADDAGGTAMADAKLRQTLREALAANGISDPAKTLSEIRTASQKLERDHPRTAAHLRAAEAFITAAQSDLVGKIHYWFDQTMDRITQRYAFYARIVTIIGAGVVAFAIPFDAVDLLKRLSTDSALRDSLVAQAAAQQAQINRLDDKDKTGQGESFDLEAAKAKRDEIEENLTKLREPSLTIVPDHFIWQALPQARLTRNQLRQPYPPTFELALGDAVFAIRPAWRSDPLADLKAALDGSRAPLSTRIERIGHSDDLVIVSNKPGIIQLRWKPGHAETNILNSARESAGWDWGLIGAALPGILISWTLLSMGAPFWYDALKGLLKLRPLLAAKDDEQRLERQTDGAK